MLEIERDAVRLDIGGYGKAGEGFRRGEEYVTVGLHESADVQSEMWDLPFPDNSVDSIWSSHTLEHAPMAKIPEALKEWCRVLKPGKRGIVQVPNFDYVAKYWLTGPDRAWAENMVFGMQSSEPDFHRSAFTTMTLRADLEAAGFNVIRIEMRWTHNQETIQGVFEKPKVPIVTN